MVSENNRQPDSNNKSIMGMSSRRTYLKAAGTGSIALLAGCGGDGGGDGGDGGTQGTSGDGEEAVIEYWRWPHSTQASNDAENAIVEDFNELDNGIRVEQVRTPFQDFQTKLKSAIGSNNAPAVGWNLWPHNQYEATGQSREEIENNAPYLLVEDMLDDSFIDQFWETMWVRQFSQFKGIATVPFVGGIDPGFLYVNVDIWNEAGLGDLPQDSWNFEGFHNAIKAMSETGTPGIGFGFKDLTSQERWVEYMVNGRMFGKLIDEGFQNEGDKYVFTVADSAMRDAWDAWFQTPIDNEWAQDPFAYTLHESLKQFYNGQHAMGSHPSWGRAGIADNADFEWNILPYPTRKGNDYWLRDASGAGMSAFKEEVGGNPEAAVEFMQFRTKAESAFKFFNVSGQAVPNKKAYQMMKDREDELSDFVKETKAMRVMEAMNSAFEKLKDLGGRRKERYPSIKTFEARGSTLVEQGIPRGAGGGQLQQQTGNMMERIARGQVGTEEGFTQMEQQWQQVLSGDGYTVNEDSVGFNKPQPGYDWA